MPLNTVQRQYIEVFLGDQRIKYRHLDECPLCNYENVTIIAEKDRYGIPLSTGVCDRCGFIFSTNQMTEESTRIFYSEYYRPIYNGIVNAALEHYKRYYNDSLRMRGIPRFIKPNGVIVEIGTGGGWNLLKFKRKGFEHYGFDYDENLVTLGKEHFGLNLYVGGIDEAIDLGVKADYCILSHVLEHTTDPLRFLSKTQLIMKEKSILKVTVPNASQLFIGGSGTGYDPLGTLQNAHNFLFDEFTLQYVALKSGFGFYGSLGEYIIMRRDKYNPRLIAVIDEQLHLDFRGTNVIKYLNFCEKLIPFKKAIIPSRLEAKLCYIYFLIKPFELFKLYKTLKSPNILDE